MMESNIVILSIPLFILILLLIFFSLSEAAVLSINRYRLKHLAQVSKGAKRVQRLLERPDRLLGMILLGNTFVVIAASSLGTLIGVNLLGEKMGVIVADALLTFVFLIFCEVAPKTLAALYPEKVAFPTSFILEILLKILYPLVWVTNIISNGLLRVFGVSLDKMMPEGMTKEELRVIVHEATGRIPSKHRHMLLSILDLEKVTVEDIMVPRNEVIGLDLDNEIDAIIGQVAHTQHTFLPVYKQDLNYVKGVIHVKSILHLLASSEFTKEKLIDLLQEALFIPEGTPLTKQMINFQQNKQRFAMVVDEYGDILGVITLEDILEEIVGEFTTNMAAAFATILKQEDGSYLVEASTTVREFNRQAIWQLPSTGPKTINGLVIEQLQEIPEAGTCCLIGGNIPIEVVQVQDNRIKTIKVFPPIVPKK